MYQLEMAKNKERLVGRSRKTMRCALCEYPFPMINLPMTISYKAVLDMRECWGMNIDRAHNPKLSFPHCYDRVRVCRMCAQFFSTSVGDDSAVSVLCSKGIVRQL